MWICPALTTQVTDLKANLDLPALRDGVHLVEEHQLPRGVEAAVVLSHLDQSIMVLAVSRLPA